MIFPKGKGAAIGICDSVLSDEDCDLIIDSFEILSDYLFDGKTVGGVNKNIKKTTDLHIVTKGDTSCYTQDQVNLMNKLDEIIFVGLNKVIGEYINEYEDELSGWLEPFDTGYQLQKYQKGEGFYRQHCDGGIYTPFPLCLRVLGVVMYLNTVKKGGGTNFPLQKYTVRPVKGRVSIFPANFTHPHIAQVPISNDKYIVSTFVQSHLLDVNSNRVILNEFGHEIY